MADNLFATNVQTIYRLFSTVFNNWSRHGDGESGAALAYYSIFSIGPIIVIATAIAGAIFGPDATTGQIKSALQGTMGESSAAAIQTIVARAHHSGKGPLASLFGAITLLFAAIGVVLQLKKSLNTIWDVDETRSSGWWSFTRTYVISIVAVLAVGFLLLVSLILTTVIAAAEAFWGLESSPLVQIITAMTSFCVISVLFAMIFKWLPDTDVQWKDVVLGALVTALLFEIGKEAIGFYIGRQGIESTYGAASSIVVMMVWVYYTSQILLFGAEITKAYSDLSPTKQLSADHQNFTGKER